MGIDVHPLFAAPLPRRQIARAVRAFLSIFLLRQSSHPLPPPALPLRSGDRPTAQDAHPGSAAAMQAPPREPLVRLGCGGAAVHPPLHATIAAAARRRPLRRTTTTRRACAYAPSSPAAPLLWSRCLVIGKLHHTAVHTCNTRTLILLLLFMVLSTCI